MLDPFPDIKILGKVQPSCFLLLKEIGNCTLSLSGWTPGLIYIECKCFNSCNGLCVTDQNTQLRMYVRVLVRTLYPRRHRDVQTFKNTLVVGLKH